MAERWRIFVVEGEENLNRNIVSSLRKDGYTVNGSTNGRDAVRVLWAEVHDVVICDLNTPGANGFELLQWLRVYRPNTRVMLFGGSTPSLRTQALEGGAVSYLEKPLNLHLLKEELRRLLVQTGFSADLDSFDLLDVIQIVSTSRKNIALLVSTGLEERGMLCFQNGNLVWAEYGMLRGEEAFFALAAHKNGTVVHQPWNQQVVPNVIQPLARLILQAFQYRTKYNQIQQQFSGEQNVVVPGETSVQDDDAPFMVLTEHVTDQIQETFPARSNAFVSINTSSMQEEVQGRNGRNGMSESEKEWWEQTGKIPSVNLHPIPSTIAATPRLTEMMLGDGDGISALSSSGQEHSGSDDSTPLVRSDLPSWLTDQPTSADIPVVHPTSSPSSARTKAVKPSIPVTPIVPPPAEWLPTKIQTPVRASRRLGEQRIKKDQPSQPQSGPLQGLDTSRRTGDTLPLKRRQIVHGGTSRGTSSSNLETIPRSTSVRRSYNYTALVSALQTLGYAINGFVAAAVVSIDGQPIAQVAVDDLDMSQMCKHLSVVMKSTFQSLDAGECGEYESVVITSADRNIFMRVVGGASKAFQVLLTTREANPIESAAVMASVEEAITAALH